MRRVLLIGCCLALVVACTRERSRDDVDETPAPTASPTPTPEPTPDQGVFFVDRAMEHVRALSVEIGNRWAGTEGDSLGASYIEAELKELGWTTEQQSFALPQGGESTNVVGTPPGFTTNEPYLIVGAHRDSIGGPGANDNATGVATVLEIARAVDARPAPLPVVAIGFGAEERQPAPGRPHHVGSLAYVQKMDGTARSNLVAMVNLDMVGRGRPLICGRLATGPTEGTQRCLQKASELGVEAIERVTPDWSDHGTFAKRGMNTAWLWTGELPCCYHNSRDTIDVIRTDDLLRSGDVALAIVRSYEGPS